MVDLFRRDIAKLREITPLHGAGIQLGVLDSHGDWIVFAVLQGGIMEMGKEVQGRVGEVK